MALPTLAHVVSKSYVLLALLHARKWRARGVWWEMGSYVNDRPGGARRP